MVKQKVDERQQREWVKGNEIPKGNQKNPRYINKCFVCVIINKYREGGALYETREWVERREKKEGIFWAKIKKCKLTT